MQGRGGSRGQVRLIYSLSQISSGLWMADGEARYDITYLNHPGEREVAEVQTTGRDAGMRGEEIDRKDVQRKGAQIVQN